MGITSFAVYQLLTITTPDCLGTETFHDMTLYIFAKKKTAFWKCLAPISKLSKKAA